MRTALERLNDPVRRRLGDALGAILGLLRYTLLCAVVFTGLVALRLALRRARRPPAASARS